MRAMLLLCGVLVGAACSDPLEQGAGDGGVPGDDACVLKRCVDNPGAYADEIVAAPGDTGEGFGDARNAVNGVRGCGGGCGSFDVFSLGYEPGVDNELILRWSGRAVVDGPGTDFVVFENGFDRGDGDRFMDPLVVSVSRDGVHWVDFRHDYRAADETVYETDPALWEGFAGVTPVRLHEEDNPVDPFNPAAAGGDAFDLADLPDDGGEGSAIRAEGFVYLRLVTAPSLENPDTGAPYVREGISNGADVDGVYARYFETR